MLLSKRAPVKTEKGTSQPQVSHKSDSNCHKSESSCSHKSQKIQLGLELGPQLGLELGQKSQRYFKKVCLYPALELKLIAQTHPESPRHPRQKYYLTELGMQLKKTQKNMME